MKLPQDYWTIDAMQKWGGSFVRQLGKCAQMADDNNLERIKKAWPEYWTEYEEMGEGLRKESEKADEPKEPTEMSGATPNIDR